MATVFVTGHRGMLGHVVARYLAQRGHRIATSDQRYRGFASDLLTLDVLAANPDVVVNCAGIVRPCPGPELLATNALLPTHLAAVLDGRPLIQPSTDCVFDGSRGWYGVDEVPNSLDAYGLSKRLGEACAAHSNVYVLRTSIVGPPGDGGRGLLGWFLGQSGPVDGWDDHFWNGITTLAWAMIAASIIETHDIAPGIHQPTTETAVSKYDLLRLFGEVFDHQIEVRREITGAGLDRTLAPTMTVPALLDQLKLLRAWR